jgi:hypothetical protein
MGEPWPRNTTTLLGRAGAAGLLLLTVGCTSDGSRDGKRDDPILGIGARPAYQAPAVATSNPVATTQGPPPPAYQPQPALTAAMPTSNAALAGGAFQPLQGGSDLRMGSTTPANVAPAPTDPRAGAAPPTTGFSPVTPVPPPGAPAPPPAPPTGTPAAGSSLDQAYTTVTAKNPLSYRMTFNSQTGEYTFQMTVPSKLNSAAVQHVEASAAAPTDAIRRTLEQLTN